MIEKPSSDAEKIVQQQLREKPSIEVPYLVRLFPNGFTVRIETGDIGKTPLRGRPAEIRQARSEFTFFGPLCQAYVCMAWAHSTGSGVRSSIESDTLVPDTI
jgi:hypothetical protein